jgi:hypothetical protein
LNIKAHFIVQKTETTEPLKLVSSCGTNQPVQTTTVRLHHDHENLHIRFDCADTDIWGTHTERNAPLYEEECVEIFIAPGETDPATYFEIEVSPLNTHFTARIHNPHSRRSDMTADLSWPCDGLIIKTSIDEKSLHWSADISLPLAALTSDRPIPTLWRANFYRIDRPRDGSPPEFTAWSPTMKTPPDFHQPKTFGLLTLA